MYKLLYWDYMKEIPLLFIVQYTIILLRMQKTKTNFKYLRVSYVKERPAMTGQLRIGFRLEFLLKMPLFYFQIVQDDIYVCGT